MLEVKYPMDNGIVRDWEDMKHVWSYTFLEKLKVDPKHCKVLLTEPPMNPSKNREKMVEVSKGNGNWENALNETWCRLVGQHSALSLL
jgi:hypothetical protein